MGGLEPGAGRDRAVIDANAGPFTLANGLTALRIVPASSDASFRRYFRVFCAAGTYVVMDAPPGKEDVRPYLKVSALLESFGAHVPHVHEADTARGLVLLEDLGSTLYLERLEAGIIMARRRPAGRKSHVPTCLRPTRDSR